MFTICGLMHLRKGLFVKLHEIADLIHIMRSYTKPPPEHLP